MINLRPAELGDARNIWLWRNHPLARVVSFNPDPIPFEDHLNWFQNRLNDDSNAFMIICDDSDLDIGYARFQIENEQAEISIALAKEAQGKRLGSAAILAASKHILNQGLVQTITAQIKVGNAISERAFRSAGYREAAGSAGGDNSIQLVFDNSEPGAGS